MASRKPWDEATLTEEIAAGIRRDGEYGISLNSLRSALLTPGTKYGTGCLNDAIKAAVGRLCSKHGWCFEIGIYGGIFKRRAMR